MSDEHSLPTFLDHLRGWYSMTALALGARTGLLDAIRTAPGTPAEIAGRAGVDERNAREWLRTLAASGHVVVSGDTFTLSDEAAMVLGPGFPVDATAVLDFVAGMPAVFADVAQAMRAGGGVEPRVYHEALGAAVGRINTPLYRMALVDEWIGGVPGLADVLAAGGAVADIACGNGDAAAIIGRAFPKARVVGYDLDPKPAGELPSNVELAVADVRDLATAGGFDLVVSLDALHHLGDPAGAVRAARQMLRAGGVLLVAETAMTGELATDMADPFAVIAFGSGLLYCLQENLAAGGSGISPGDGTAWLVDALRTEGFTDIVARASATGYRVVSAVA